MGRRWFGVCTRVIEQTTRIGFKAVRLRQGSYMTGVGRTVARFGGASLTQYLS